MISSSRSGYTCGYALYGGGYLNSLMLRTRRKDFGRVSQLPITVALAYQPHEIPRHNLHGHVSQK